MFCFIIFFIKYSLLYCHKIMYKYYLIGILMDDGCGENSLNCRNYIEK